MRTAPLLPGPVYALLTAVCWSIAVVLFKKSGDAIHPLGLNALKSTVALLLFALTFAVAGEVPHDLSGREVALLLASGAAGIGIADTLFLNSLNQLGASRAAIVECAYTPSVVLAAYALLGERLSLLHAAGGALILGAVLLAAPRAEGPALPRRDFARGVALGGFSMALMGAAIVMIKPILERREVLLTTPVRLLGGIATIFLWAAADRAARRETWRAFLPQRAWRSALPGSVVGTYLSMTFWIAAFKYSHAGVASILSQTATVFTVLLAAIFLREPLDGRRAAAVALAFTGSALVLL